MPSDGGEAGLDRDAQSSAGGTEAPAVTLAVLARLAALDPRGQAAQPTGASKAQNAISDTSTAAVLPPSRGPGSGGMSPRGGAVSSAEKRAWPSPVRGWSSAELVTSKPW